MLQNSSKICDLVGMLSPVTVRAKMLMQDLWQRNAGWDEPLPQNLREDWTAMVKDTVQLQQPSPSPDVWLQTLKAMAERNATHIDHRRLTSQTVDGQSNCIILVVWEQTTHAIHEQPCPKSQTALSRITMGILPQIQQSCRPSYKKNDHNPAYFFILLVTWSNLANVRARAAVLVRYDFSYNHSSDRNRRVLRPEIYYL